MSTDFNAFADINYFNGNEWLLVTRGGAGLNAPINALPWKDASGNYRFSGRIGVNTDTPAVPLDVNGHAKFGPTSGARLSTYTDGGYVGFFNGASLGEKEAIYFGQGGHYFYASGVEVLCILGSEIWGRGDNQQSLGGPSRRFSVVYAGSGTISTSDERAKSDISAIPDEWLDAWGDVEWCRYRFKDAVEVKPEGARWHVGLIAQHVRDAFTARNLDALSLGLLCHDEWPEQREPVYEDVEVTKTRVSHVPTGQTVEIGGETLQLTKEVVETYTETERLDTGQTRVTVEAGDRWGLRYEECLAMEAAWNRRELKRSADLQAALQARLAALECGE